MDLSPKVVQSQGNHEWFLPLPKKRNAHVLPFCHGHWFCIFSWMLLKFLDMTTNKISLLLTLSNIHTVTYFLTQFFPHFVQSIHGMRWRHCSGIWCQIRSTQENPSGTWICNQFDSGKSGVTRYTMEYFLFLLWSIFPFLFRCMFLLLLSWVTFSKLWLILYFVHNSVFK